MKIPSGMRVALPLLILASLGSHGHLTAQDRTLKFAWPVPADVIVTEERKEHDHTLLLEYKIEVRPTQYEGISVIRKRDFKVLRLDGLETAAPSLRGMVAHFEANLAVVPDLYIDKEGQMVDLETWDSYSARAGQLIGELQRDQLLSTEDGNELLALRRLPEMRQTLRVLATEFWVLWVNGWLDLDFTRSSALEVPGEFPLSGGGVVKAPQILRHNGPEPGMEGYVRLTMESRLEGADVKKTLIEELYPSVATDTVSRAEVANMGWVVLRPDTMQPTAALTQNRKFLVAGEETREEIQFRAYKLEWK